MPTTISSREFNHDVGSAKRAAEAGPVIVTDRGAPAFVLLRYEDYRRLTGHGETNILDLLDHPEGAEIEFEPPRLGQDLFVPPDMD